MKVTVTFVSQLSVTSGSPGGGIGSPHSIVRSGGQVKTGGVVSLAVAVNESVQVSPSSSVTVRVITQLRLQGEEKVTMVAGYSCYS